MGGIINNKDKRKNDVSSIVITFHEPDMSTFTSMCMFNMKRYKYVNHRCENAVWLMLAQAEHIIYSLTYYEL